MKEKIPRGDGHIHIHGELTHKHARRVIRQEEYEELMQRGFKESGDFSTAAEASFSFMSRPGCVWGFSHLAFFIGDKIEP